MADRTNTHTADRKASRPDAHLDLDGLELVPHTVSYRDPDTGRTHSEVLNRMSDFNVFVASSKNTAKSNHEIRLVAKDLLFGSIGREVVTDDSKASRIPVYYTNQAGVLREADNRPTTLDMAYAKPGELILVRGGPRGTGIEIKSGGEYAVASNKPRRARDSTDAKIHTDPETTTRLASLVAPSPPAAPKTQDKLPQIPTKEPESPRSWTKTPDHQVVKSGDTLTKVLARLGEKPEWNTSTVIRTANGKESVSTLRNTKHIRPGDLVSVERVDNDPSTYRVVIERGRRQKPADQPVAPPPATAIAPSSPAPPTPVAPTTSFPGALTQDYPLPERVDNWQRRMEAHQNRRKMPPSLPTPNGENFQGLKDFLDDNWREGGVRKGQNITEFGGSIVVQTSHGRFYNLISANELDRNHLFGYQDKQAIVARIKDHLGIPKPSGQN